MRSSDARRVSVLSVVIAILSWGCASGASATPAASQAASAPPPTAAASEAPTPAPSAIASAQGSQALTEQCSHPSNGKPCSVAMVVPGVANDFRVQEVKTATSASKKDPYASAWDFSTIVTDNTPEAQNAALNNLLAKGVDAILLVAVSDTSANAAVTKACAQGVKVVTFDTTANAGACEVRLAFDGAAWGQAPASYFAKATGCTGTFLFDQGLQGVSLAATIYNTEVSTTKALCGSKVKTIGFFSEYNPAKSATILASLLSANPDISAVMNTACSSTYKVFKNAGAKIPVLGCQGYNGDVLTLVQNPGVNGISTAATGADGYGAMELAYMQLAGQTVPQDTDWPSEFIVTDTSIDLGTTKYPKAMAAIGTNAFPNLPGGFFVYYQWPNSIVPIVLNDAIGQ